MPLTHLNERGDAVMVDVSNKAVTKRRAVASGRIRMSAECFRSLMEGNVPKGDAFGVARVAGIMAAKRASDWIPLCHPLPIAQSTVDFTPYRDACEIEAICSVACEGKTGVEMEALTGVTAALLTLYDMLKALDKRMSLSEIRLVEKHGGKSGDFFADGAREP